MDAPAPLEGISLVGVDIRRALAALLLCAALAGSGVAQNMGQWVGGEHCAGSHCGPGKEEKRGAKRCDNPAGAGAHVLYNASVAVGDDKEHLTTRWVHAVVRCSLSSPTATEAL